MLQYTAKYGLKKGFSYKSLLFPIVLLQHSITEKRSSETQLYVVLKLLSEGQTRLSGSDLCKIARLIDASFRTVQRRLKKLIKWNWIGYCEKSGFYFIRGFKKICEIEGLKGSMCAEFNPEWIGDFDAFASGAIIGDLVKQQIRRDKRLGLNSGRPAHGRSNPASLFKPVATEALCKIFDISYGHAYRMKQNGQKFLVKDNPKKHTKCLGIDSKQFPELLRVRPELSGKVFMNNGQIWLNPIDHFKSELYLKSCRRYRLSA